MGTTFDFPLIIGIFGRLKNGNQMSGFQDFCVVVPMFNEIEGAADCVRRVSAVLQDLGERPVLIAVDDGSTDGTGNALQSLCSEFPRLLVIKKHPNEGYGAALRTGAEAAFALGYEYVIFMDSDLTNDPSDIPKFASKMELGIDVIKASRFVIGGGMDGVPRRRWVFSKLGNVVGCRLARVGLHDVTNGFRAVRLSVLLRTVVKERGFASIVEELYQCKKLGATFAEVPVVLTNRADNLRPTAFTYKPSTFYRYLKYCLLAFAVTHPKKI